LRPSDRWSLAANDPLERAPPTTNKSKAFMSPIFSARPNPHPQGITHMHETTLNALVNRFFSSQLG